MDINFYYLDDCKEEKVLKTDIGRVIDYFYTDSTKLNYTFYNREKDRYELKNIPEKNKTNILIISVTFFKTAKTYADGIWYNNILYSSDLFIQSNTCLNTIKYFLERGFYVFFDRSLETNFFDRNLLSLFVEKYVSYGIDFSKIIFLTNNFHYRKFKQEIWNKVELNILYFPYFLFLSHIVANTVDDKFNIKNKTTDSNKTRDFLIPNRYSRYCRVKFLLELDKLGLLNNSEWSLSSTLARKLPKELTGTTEYTNFLSKYNLDLNKGFFKTIGGTSFNYLKHNGKINTNQASFYYPETSFKCFDVIDNIQFFLIIPDFDFWDKGKVYIVCETHVSGKIEWLESDNFNTINSIHLTEKIFKPIRLKMPFTVLGEKDSLKVLQEFGFFTFDSIIDEQYDSIELYYKYKHANYSTPELDRKINKLIDSSNKLLNSYNSKQVQNICEHNFNHIRNKEYFSYIFNTYFINSINEFHRFTATDRS